MERKQDELGGVYLECRFPVLLVDLKIPWRVGRSGTLSATRGLTC